MTTPSLPTPGQDLNTWGAMLNAFLSVSLNNPGGTLKSSPAVAIPVTGPTTSQPTVWQLPDGSMLHLPLSTYGLSGDDAVWATAAAAACPVITGGPSQYGGTYNGPWTVGTIRHLPADYHFNTPFNIPQGGTLNLIGHGPGTRIFAGNGVTPFIIRGYGGGWTPSQPAMQTHARISGYRIDGSGVGNGAFAGIDIGGGWGHKISDVTIANFNGTNNMGLRFANIPSVGPPIQNAAWTEKAEVWVTTLNCTTGVEYDEASSNGSYEYNQHHFFIQAGTGQQGVNVTNGSFLYGTEISMQGNFADGSGPTLNIVGSDSGTFSSLSACRLFWSCEHNNPVSGSKPVTINFGVAGNTMNNCTGSMRFGFSAGSWQPSNATAAQFSFGGMVTGDNNLKALAAQSGNQVDGWNIG